MIALQKFDKTGYERLIRWIDSEETLMQFTGPAFTFPLTNEQLEKSINDKNRFAFKVVHLPTEDIIGHAEIYLTEKSAYLSRILIGDKLYRNKGFGGEIVERLLEYAFLNLKQLKIELNVFEWNTAARKCYVKSGFVINPDKKSERKVNGKTWTALNMTLGKDEWQERRRSIIHFNTQPDNNEHFKNKQ